MSKVVHLSDVAHARAKGYCQQAGLKMSEWVAVLIDRAVGSHAAPSTPRSDGEPEANPTEAKGEALAASQRPKAVVALHAGEAGPSEGGMPLYAAPPFWANNRTRGGGLSDPAPAP